MTDEPKQEFLFDEDAWRKPDDAPPTPSGRKAKPGKATRKKAAPTRSGTVAHQPRKAAVPTPPAPGTGAPPEEAPPPGESPAGDAPPPDGNGSTHYHIPDDAGPLQHMMDENFLAYASYVICDRAIPALEDGLKPVQRRILWSLHERDDGRFTKVANIVGHTMQFHPHGDASIGDALVNLVNKRYLIEGQGNFGNVFTGDRAAAARYIECRLTPLARDEIFNDELTTFIPNYDGRKKEPVTLPAKLPLLLMLGAEGIAVGLSTRILPHNFGELLEAQIAILEDRPFELHPDFQQGGLMDISEYDRGLGKIKLRARIEKPKNNTRLVIREVPFGVTTESLTNSIEDAVRKKKVPVRTINDFTAEAVEIELVLSPGADQDKTVKALYAFTLCETAITSRPTVICNNRPMDTTVDEILRENTRRLLDILKRELECKQQHLLDAFHQKTLVQIFVENRIYKRIEECKTYPEVTKAIEEGLAPFRDRLKRDIVPEDIEMLLGVRIRRISLFDINRNRQEIEGILDELDQVAKHLKRIKAYAIRYLRNLIKTYAGDYPRCTRITTFSEVQVRELTARELKICHDKERGYIGHDVSGDLLFECSSYDKLIVVLNNGRYRVIPPPDKLYVGNDLTYCQKADRDKELTVIYTDTDSGFTYMKRFTIGGFILDREYTCTTESATILLFSDQNPETVYVKYKPAKNQRIHQQSFHPAETPVKGAKARGNQMTAKKVARIADSQPRWWDTEDDSPRGRLL